MSQLTHCAYCQKDRFKDDQVDRSVPVRRAVNIIGGVPACDHHIEDALLDRDRLARAEHDIAELGQRVTDHIEDGMTKDDVIELVRQALNAEVVRTADA